MIQINTFLVVLNRYFMMRVSSSWLRATQLGIKCTHWCVSISVFVSFSNIHFVLLWNGFRRLIFWLGNKKVISICGIASKFVAFQIRIWLNWLQFQLCQLHLFVLCHKLHGYCHRVRYRRFDAMILSILTAREWACVSVRGNAASFCKQISHIDTTTYLANSDI